MARVTKDSEIRRAELLDVAFELCQSQSFESMSVEQVTGAAGVAKGTFYHYFASKSDLQEQMVARLGDAIFDHLSQALTNLEGSGAQRLGGLMHASASFKAAQTDLSYASFLYRDQNFALRHRLYAAWRERARAVIAPVIVDGVKDGSIRVSDVEVATDLVLLLWFDAADHLWSRAITASDAPSFAAVMVEGAAAITQAQERILGVPQGTYFLPISASTRTAIEGLYTNLHRTRQ